MSCTCECLGARRCYWFNGRHGNLPHLSPTAAESSMRRHTHTQSIYAHTHAYSYLFLLSICQSNFSLLSLSLLVCLSSSHPSSFTSTFPPFSLDFTFPSSSFLFLTPLSVLYPTFFSPFLLALTLIQVYMPIPLFDRALLL